MIQRGSDTSFTNLWSLLLYIQSLLHYIENAQENKKNTILSYKIAENSKQIKVITKLPNSEQSYKGKVKTHNHINRQNQSTNGKL
jgi:hypothetical protein